MNSLYILSKQEFTSLYRFGKIPLQSNRIISANNLSKEEIGNKILKGFKRLPYFAGDEEYLVIRFENKPIEKELRLLIEDVYEIIPLTKEAKNSLQLKFDSNILFQDARFEKVVRKFEEYIDIEEMKRGSEIFWKLCRVKGNLKKNLLTNVITDVYKHRINGIKSMDINGDYYTHLLVYERYKSFPKTDLGFFYDIGEIFAHFKNKPTFIGSGLHSFLQENRSGLEYKTFIQKIDFTANHKRAEKFTNQLTHNGLKKYIVAVIFLKFKADLSERETISGSETGRLIRDFRNEEKYVEELNLAIYLTGAFFGYKKFYEDFYKSSDLKIFKSNSNQSYRPKQEESKQEESKQEESKQEEPKQEEPLSIYDIILQYVKDKGHCKIKPDIVDLVKEKTGKKYNVTNIESVIKNNPNQELELKKKNRAKGVRIRDNGFFSEGD